MKRSLSQDIFLDCQSGSEDDSESVEIVGSKSVNVEVVEAEFVKVEVTKTKSVKVEVKQQVQTVNSKVFVSPSVSNFKQPIIPTVRVAPTVTSEPETNAPSTPVKKEKTFDKTTTSFMTASQVPITVDTYSLERAADIMVKDEKTDLDENVPPEFEDY